MASPSDSGEIAHDFSPFFKVYKDGHVEKLVATEKVPAIDELDAGFRSKDVVISITPIVSARMYIPTSLDPSKKLPLVLYFHGGGFCISSAFHPDYHKFQGSLATKAGIIVISIEYRLAPENPIPACYDDSITAFHWVASHSKRDGPELWLNDHADFDRVFLSGDSAGGNICHNLATQIGPNGTLGVKLVGMGLIHPFFGGRDQENNIWMYLCPGSKGLADPRLKPRVEDFSILGCEKVVVFMAERDFCREGDEHYCEALKRSTWKGHLEVVEHKGEDHVFHLINPESSNAIDLMDKLISFFLQQ